MYVKTLLKEKEQYNAVFKNITIIKNYKTIKQASCICGRPVFMIGLN
ncbi:hypothetical protein QE417_003073 [Mucilaginibacter terrae]|uniref:Uncharacterized protein n=1 Tax=Mucilaginibacter terrae TaxID=1955052 RepID=A0ABU3GX03_9SPHI|nr:hypothetical protein [Mucilaginibacter terrae]